MGYMIKNFRNEFSAPDYSDNANGTPMWAGVSAEDFTDSLESDLRAFIINEAKRLGNNDVISNRKAEICMFHEKFLGGWPFELWIDCYQQGVETAKAFKAKTQNNYYKS